MIALTPALRLLLAVLACFRLSELFAVDYGPFMVFDLWRSFLGRMASGKGRTTLAHSLADLFHCPYCLGIWLALPLAYFWLYPNFISDVVIIWLGFAGGQSLLQSLTKSGSKRDGG